jgi:hypothetical protein
MHENAILYSSKCVLYAAIRIDIAECSQCSFISQEYALYIFGVTIIWRACIDESCLHHSGGGLYTDYKPVQLSWTEHDFRPDLVSYFH